MTDDEVTNVAAWLMAQWASRYRSSLAAFESSDHQMAVRRTDSGQPAQPWYGEFASACSSACLRP